MPKPTLKVEYRGVGSKVLKVFLRYWHLNRVMLAVVLWWTLSSLRGYRGQLELIALFCKYWIADFLSTRYGVLLGYLTILIFISDEGVYTGTAEVRSGKYAFFCFFFCICVFKCSNLLCFFFFFESRIVPIVLWILSAGSQPERVQAGLQIVMYTFCSCVPLLLFICHVMAS